MKRGAPSHVGVQAAERLSVPGARCYVATFDLDTL